MREMRIWPQYAAKCCKNAGKFCPDVIGNRRVRFNFRRGTPAAGVECAGQGEHDCSILSVLQSN